METWFEFKAYNSQSIYAFGTADEADRYADFINKGKEVNLYAAYEVSEEDAKELDLDNNSEAFNLGDTLSEIEN